MKFELSQERLEEMVLCIVHNQLSEDEAMDYAVEFVREVMSDDAIEVEDE